MSDLLVDAAVRVLGFALLAGGVGTVSAFVYRWYSTDALSDGVAVLTGLSAVAVWLNTKTALGDAIIGETALFDPLTALYTVTVFVASAIAADAGRRFGDYLARDAVAAATPQTVDEVTQFVRSGGRVTALTLPETVEDVPGYDPVDDARKAALAGSTLRLPRSDSRAELEERLVSRLERDYAVGVVEVSFADDATVSRLAVGSRRTGLGPTLAPGTVALAVEADPAPDASPGDAVEVWHAPRPGAAVDDPDASDGSLATPSPDAPADDAARRLGTAEVRATAGNVATLAVSPSLAARLSAREPVRLVTLPVAPDAGREFVSVLRSASETVLAVTVGADGDDLATGLEGSAVGSLPVVVLGLERDGRARPLPEESTVLEHGDRVFLVGRPAAIRRLATASG
ncbi:TrkA C-terminal domain-containing protein [Natronobiforma cellulositropha]|uniref:TrkA C-terminal domain-containing protein n=1 Tax=Natronobiforma cellulositropha TaxID=1679076 RepID=UPI0021D582B8|nr:TrkA C-terminal domain-containing protein [Natronobiforma cellulositropha]